MEMDIRRQHWVRGLAQFARNLDCDLLSCWGPHLLPGYLSDGPGRDEGQDLPAEVGPVRVHMVRGFQRRP